MSRRKFFAIVFVTIALISIGAVTVQAAGSIIGSQSETVVIKVRPEPVSIQLVGAYDEGGEQITVQLYPGEEGISTYRVVNEAWVDYIVELNPVFTGEADLESWITYQFESSKEAEIGLTGSSLHLMVASSGTTQINFRVRLRRDAPAALETSFQMYLRRTDCTVLEGCPWG